MKISIIALLNALAITLLSTGCGQTKQPEAIIPQRKFDASYSHAAAIDEDGTLWTWGANNYGQLGNGTQTDQVEPVAVVQDAIGVKVCENSTVIWKKDGRVWVCGKVPLCDELVLIPIPLQLDLDGLNEFQIADIAIQSVDFYLCDQERKLWHVHNNTVDLLMENVETVDCFWGNVAILQTDGTLWVSSLNEYGQAGDGTTNEYYEPVQVMADVSMVSMGEKHVCALKNDGTVWTWGGNSIGQIGNGTVETQYVPTIVFEDAVSVSTSGSTTMAIKSDGSLWGWGSSLAAAGYIDEVGNGVIWDRPVKVMDDVVYAAPATIYSIVVKTDGTVWSWGWNKICRLGYEGGTFLREDGTYVQETPKQIPGLKVTVPDQ